MLSLNHASLHFIEQLRVFLPFRKTEFLKIKSDVSKILLLFGSSVP